MKKVNLFLTTTLGVILLFSCTGGGNNYRPGLNGVGYPNKYVGTWIGKGYEITLYKDGSGKLKVNDGIMNDCRWEGRNHTPTESQKSEGYTFIEFAYIYFGRDLNLCLTPSGNVYLDAGSINSKDNLDFHVSKR